MASVNEAALTRRRLVVLERLRTTTAAQLARQWHALDNYVETEPWLRVARPVLTAAQVRAAAVQHAYLEAVVGRLPTDLGAVLDKAAVDLTQPFVSLAQALDNGLTFEAAVDAGAERASGVAESGVQWAARAANGVADDRVRGWQRVPDPGACDWCQLVAQQTYHTADSASFGHLRCFCDVQPVT